jgi:hypothetical protein
MKMLITRPLLVKKAANEAVLSEAVSRTWAFARENFVKRASESIGSSVEEDKSEMS